ncbi:hypothetical protein [Ruminococcus flavefaciens]|uniref:Uncharacterized protein n=1 Tax=Ruminococcus flavefaciens TaxID=1265 RepID=A0A1M7IED4_RUMFL|nr:hypothetical protein [Ruminococcus flavefaciens]SHM39039.1 hypothetical protein SAMN04487860_10467 [Ruminococcus flavefaciens]
MKWITLIGDDTLTLKLIKDMKHTGALKAYDVKTNRFCLEYSDGHILYDFDTDLSDWQDDLADLPFKATCCIMMIYTNSKNVRNELLQPDFPQNVYVDNDHGIILPLKEYIAVGMPMDD